MLNKSVLIYILIVVLNSPQATRAQNLFGIENSEKYAEFLLTKKNYENGASEYERLLFLDSSKSDIYKDQLVLCYHYLNNLPAIYSLGIKQFTNRNSNLIFKSFLKNRDYISASLLLDSSSYTFSHDEKKINKHMIYLFTKDFKNASQIINSNFSEATIKKHKNVLQPISDDLIGFKPKSPVLAAGMSTILPGAGRLYTKDYADAAINFVFIAVTAIQAYRGFTNPNIGEWQGWVYGSLSASFYLANIFGSGKAANRFNKKYYDEKVSEASTYYFNYY